MFVCKRHLTKNLSTAKLQRELEAAIEMHRWRSAWLCWSGFVWRFPSTESCRHGWCPLRAEPLCPTDPWVKIKINYNHLNEAKSLYCGFISFFTTISFPFQNLNCYPISSIKTESITRRNHLWTILSFVVWSESIFYHVTPQ